MENKAPTTPSPERQPADAGGGLLPCPWCGGEGWLNDYEARWGDMPPKSRCPQCRSCGANLGYRPTPAKAIAAWNRRSPAPQAQPDARAVEALRRIERNPVSFSHAASQLARETLQALSAPAADDGWRPIESAPKDGTHFLAVDECGDACRCAYHSEGYLLSFCGQPVVQPFDPILWMPWRSTDPAAPTDEVGKS